MAGPYDCAEVSDGLRDPRRKDKWQIAKPGKCETSDKGTRDSSAAGDGVARPVEPGTGGAIIARGNGRESTEPYRRSAASIPLTLGRISLNDR